MDLGDADPASMVASDRAPVLALAGGDAPFVLHWVCEEDATSEEECALTRSALEGLTGGNAVLVTSAGNYVVGTHKESMSVLGWKVERDRVRLLVPSDPTADGPRDPAMPPIEDVTRLVASLRNSDIVIARDLQGRLVRFDPSTGTTDRIAPKQDDLMLAAVGERHIVGRVTLDAENEELWLVPVDVVEDPLQDRQPDPVRLSTEGTASRIVVTPRDEFVAITYGEGDSAQTQVFRVPDGRKLQGWTGAMVSGRDDGGELPGLRAVSPDGSQIAYRTEQGSLAMRSLLSHSSCLVHSSGAESTTRLAGFSADGVLYYEMEEGLGRTAVNAWTPHRRERRRLSEPDDGFTLVSVPARSRNNGEHPWAFGIDDGQSVALQAEKEPTFLGLKDMVIVPRDDDDIWVVHTDRPPHSDIRTVRLRRVVPRWSDQLRALAFDDPTDQRYDHAGMSEQLAEQFSGPTRVCLSTGAPGSWAYTCGEASERTFLAAPTTPSSEDPFGNAMDDPEVPAVGDAWDCGGGQPDFQTTQCRYHADTCCFDTLGAACDWMGCDVTNPCTTSGAPITVTCASAAEPGPG